jgi:hypothetical protein
MTEHEPILSPDAVKEIKRKEAKREKDKLRKRVERGREKAERLGIEYEELPEVQAEMANDELDRFHERNRREMSESYISKLRKREEAVFELETQIDACFSGTSTLNPSELDANVKADVAENGLIECDITMDQFWTKPELFARLIETADKPTGIWLRFGIRIAIMDWRFYQKWQPCISRHRGEEPKQVESAPVFQETTPPVLEHTEPSIEIEHDPYRDPVERAFEAAPDLIAEANRFDNNQYVLRPSGPTKSEP